MPISKSQQRAVQAYNKKSYDDIRVRAKKGQRAVIQSHAEQMGESVNSFVLRAIDETIMRDKNKENKLDT
ncbi:MAG: hypothetical protein IKN81_06185 [Oscillospiraceae bacterium]|nr:hypothetical protein [Oscillospiraceae bacterium]